MLPFMAQGTGTAVEDALVLARCLTTLVPEVDVGHALASRGDHWLKEGVNDWSRDTTHGRFRSVQAERPTSLNPGCPP
jgi:2-polyprenyl-6-methoxyphenol hydroxylase-like FAD-dependent oxidoreductase